MSRPEYSDAVSAV